MDGNEASPDISSAANPVVPELNDVLLGRGRTRILEWEGNRRYTAEIEVNIRRYKEAKTRTERSTIVLEIARRINSWGRFLEQPVPNGPWYVADLTKVRKKIGQALRYQMENVKYDGGATPRQTARDVAASVAETVARQTAEAATKPRAIEQLEGILAASSTAAPLAADGGGDDDDSLSIDVSLSAIRDMEEDENVTLSDSLVQHEQLKSLTTSAAPVAPPLLSDRDILHALGYETALSPSRPQPQATISPSFAREQQQPIPPQSTAVAGVPMPLQQQIYLHHGTLNEQGVSPMMLRGTGHTATGGISHTQQQHPSTLPIPPNPPTPSATAHDFMALPSSSSWPSFATSTADHFYRQQQSHTSTPNIQLQQSNFAPSYTQQQQQQNPQAALPHLTLDEDPTALHLLQQIPISTTPNQSSMEQNPPPLPRPQEQSTSNVVRADSQSIAPHSWPAQRQPQSSPPLPQQQLPPIQAPATPTRQHNQDHTNPDSGRPY